MFVLAAAAAFCAFGLLATLEPGDAGARWVWRIIYAAAAVACAVGVVVNLRAIRGRGR